MLRWIALCLVAVVVVPYMRDVLKARMEAESIKRNDVFVTFGPTSWRASELLGVHVKCVEVNDDKNDLIVTYHLKTDGVVTIVYPRPDIAARVVFDISKWTGARYVDVFPPRQLVVAANAASISPMNNKDDDVVEDEDDKDKNTSRTQRAKSQDE